MQVLEASVGINGVLQTQQPNRGPQAMMEAASALVMAFLSLNVCQHKCTSVCASTHNRDVSSLMINICAYTQVCALLHVIFPLSSQFTKSGKEVTSLERRVYVSCDRSQLRFIWAIVLRDTLAAAMQLCFMHFTDLLNFHNLTMWRLL